MLKGWRSTSTMSGNKIRSVEMAQTSLQTDDDLLCLICKELVDDAKLVDCCGGLFCARCIDALATETRFGRHNCPQCQSVLVKTNILSDPRSDRKSAAQLRHCPFHIDDCKFIGTRQEVAEHKTVCPMQPLLCSDPGCIQTVEALRQIIKDSNKEAKQSLLEAALMHPEDILKEAGDFHGAAIWNIDNIRKYSVFTGSNRSQPSPLDVEIVCNDQTAHNVSLFCSRRKSAVPPAGGFPCLQVTVTLISFDPSVVENIRTQIYVGRDVVPGSSWGVKYWLRSETFKKYHKYGKFAMGWTVAYAA